jgi:hypothetical protein
MICRICCRSSGRWSELFVDDLADRFRRQDRDGRRVPPLPVGGRFRFGASDNFSVGGSPVSRTYSVPAGPFGALIVEVDANSMDGYALRVDDGMRVTAPSMDGSAATGPLLVPHPGGPLTLIVSHDGTFANVFVSITTF